MERKSVQPWESHASAGGLKMGARHDGLPTAAVGVSGGIEAMHVPVQGALVPHLQRQRLPSLQVLGGDGRRAQRPIHQSK